MSENILDTPYSIQTIYTKFIIISIDIQFNEPAIINIRLLQDEPVSASLVKTISIPVEIYEGWQFSQIQIINYVKNYLLNN